MGGLSRFSSGRLLSFSWQRLLSRGGWWMVMMHHGCELVHVARHFFMYKINEVSGPECTSRSIRDLISLDAPVVQNADVCGLSACFVARPCDGTLYLYMLAAEQ